SPMIGDFSTCTATRWSGARTHTMLMFQGKQGWQLLIEKKILRIYQMAISAFCAAGPTALLRCVCVLPTAMTIALPTAALRLGCAWRGLTVDSSYIHSICNIFKMVYNVCQ